MPSNNRYLINLLKQIVKEGIHTHKMKEIYNKEIENQEPLIPYLIRKSKESKRKGISRKVRKKMEELELIKLELEEAKLKKQIKELE